MSKKKKYNVIILADSVKGPLYEEFGQEHKALIPIHGKPILDWVVGAFHKSELIDNIIVVGDEVLDQLASMRHVRARVMPGVNFFQSIIHGITYMKTSVYGLADKHNGYLLAFGDAVFLTPDIIDEVVDHVSQSRADLVLHYTERKLFDKLRFKDERVYIPLGKKQYTDTNIYYISRFNMIASLIEELSQFKGDRKDHKPVLKMLGCDYETIPEIETFLSKKISAKAKIFITQYHELSMEVDTPQDLDKAKRLLRNPWQHKYQKAKLIYNPHAGKGMSLSPFLKSLLGMKQRKFDVPSSQEDCIAKIKKYLAEYHIHIEVSPTQFAGHATQFARQCVNQNYDLVIAAGGDGTINEVINGLAGSEVALGIIPLGTANVFGIEMKIPMELKAACQVIASGQTRKIDLGCANGRYFVCMAGIGFDAHVLKKADSKLKKIYGALAYAIVGITQIFSYRFRRIIVRIDDQRIPRHGIFVVIGNGKYYGGGMMFASRADLTDGYLDVCIFRHKSLFSVFSFLFGFHRGNIDKHLNIEYFQCKSVTIYKKGKHPVHVDAEYLCDTPVNIEVHPQSLKVAV
ncbi:MAG: YegS/Rv2252/BmrU family lipid kinase [Candidatus Omnitrophica bacterium]|nr:YegS/Rv2252/BmrU family lipid kinase [Candidatus Omnitrophota bacterium]